MTNLDLNRRRAKKSLVTACVISTLLLQAACSSGGGGGDSHSNPPSGDNSPPRVTVTGTAAKGLLLDAVVTFYPITNGSIGDTPLATVRTSAEDGSFSSPVSASGAVAAVLTVDEATRMLDEVSGERIPAPNGLVLHAVFPSLTNLQPLAITPLTELAYKQAISSNDGLTVTTIDAANSAISSVFLNGASILQTLPIDVTKYANATPAQQAQAKLLTAISVAAFQNIATGENGAACAGEYPENVPCVVEGLSKIVSVTNAGATLNAQASYLDTAYNAINTGLVKVAGKTPAELGMDVPTAAETELVNNIREQNPLPGYNPNANPLVNTKDLIANIRTNIVKQGALESVGFSETVDRLGDDFEDNVDAVASTTVEILPTVYGCALALSGETEEVDCNLTNATTAVEEIYDGYDFDYEEGDYGSHSYSSVEWFIKTTVTKTSDTEYSVTTRPFRRYWSSTVTCLTPVYQECTYEEDSGETAVAPELTAKFTLTTTGAAHSATFTGPFYVTASGGQVTADLEAAQSNDWDDEKISGSITFSGSLSNGKGGIALKRATLGASAIHVRNGRTAAEDLAYTEVTHQYGDYTWTDRVGLPRTIAGNPAIAVWGTIDLGEWVTDEFAYEGKLTVAEPTYDKSKTLGIPGSVKLEASVREVLPGNVYAPFFNGSIGINLLGAAGFDATKTIVEDNTLTAQLYAIGTLNLSSGRVLSVSATINVDGPTSEAAVDEDGEPVWGLVEDRPASFSVTYRYSTSQGTAELNASGEYDSEGNLKGSITNNAGVIITLSKPHDGKLSGKITANGTETATIDDSGTVYYTDGSSESVF